MDNFVELVCLVSCKSSLPLYVANNGILLVHNSAQGKRLLEKFPTHTMVWDVRKDATMPKNIFNVRIICTFSPVPQFSIEAQQFILQQHQQYRVPILFFPYPCSPKYELQLLQDLHPLIFESDQTWPSKNADAKHPIMQNCTDKSWLQTSTEHRDAARAKTTSTVLAVFNDGAPMICELGDTVCINMCLTNSDGLENLIECTLQYLVTKMRRPWKIFPICKQFGDVQIQVF